MKQCPRCNQTYSDENLNFCLNDGELLTGYTQEPSSPRFQDQPPPTMILDQARVTNPTTWPASQPGTQPPAQWQPAAAVPFGQQAPYLVAMPSQGLAITSLCLGIASMTVGFCCYLGILLSPAAMVTGFIYLSQNKKDPVGYPARGMAIGGIVTGVVYFAILALIIIIYGAAILMGGIR